MKRLAWFSIVCIVCIVCMGLSGCTILNAWIVKGDIKDVQGAYPPYSAEAGRGDVIFSRYFLLTTEKAKPLIDSIPHMKVTVDADNKIKSTMIGTVKEDKVNSEVAK